MRKRLYKWWVESDFWWVWPSILGTAAVTFAVMDAVDPYTSDYRMWAAGCVVAMLLHALRVGSRL